MQPPSSTTYGSIHFLNIEYFFLLIYDFYIRVTGQGAGGGGLGITLSHIWTIVTVLAYLITIFFIFVLVYATMRLYQTREEEEHDYETIEPAELEKRTEHSRWNHIASLIESGQESDWRQAIIESDIMLFDILALHGYQGDSVGEKLKQGDPQRFQTLQDAWEAHKVRNEIAHQGSAYELTNQGAYRTIARYKNVFEEFHAI